MPFGTRLRDYFCFHPCTAIHRWWRRGLLSHLIRNSLPPSILVYWCDNGHKLMKPLSEPVTRGWEGTQSLHHPVTVINQISSSRCSSLQTLWLTARGGNVIQVCRRLPWLHLIFCCTCFPGRHPSVMKTSEQRRVIMQGLSCFKELYTKLCMENACTKKKKV